MTTQTANPIICRTYTSAEIAELIDVLRDSGDIDPAELMGMERLGQLLKRFERMTDDDIADMVRRHFRSV
jgi:hypothetical protein